MADAEQNKTYWLSYGAGVNSTALLILLSTGRLPQYTPFRVLFSDTKTERPETYSYLGRITTWASEHGVTIETCYPKEGVLERWKRLSVCGNRMMRACTVEAKIRPMERYLKEHGTKEDPNLIGIHAGESHRAKPAYPNERTRLYPLVDLDIDHEGCQKIIRDAGLCVPFKSGCWCCPFLRVREILELAKDNPDKFAEIIALEEAANANHPGDTVRIQWGKPAKEYLKRVHELDHLPFDDENDQLPCECFSS